MERTYEHRRLSLRENRNEKVTYIVHQNRTVRMFRPHNEGLEKFILREQIEEKSDRGRHHIT